MPPGLVYIFHNGATQYYTRSQIAPSSKLCKSTEDTIWASSQNLFTSFYKWSCTNDFLFSCISNTQGCGFCDEAEWNTEQCSTYNNSSNTTSVQRLNKDLACRREQKRIFICNFKKPAVKPNGDYTLWEQRRLICWSWINWLNEIFSVAIIFKGKWFCTCRKQPPDTANISFCSIVLMESQKQKQLHTKQWRFSGFCMTWLSSEAVF